MLPIDRIRRANVIIANLLEDTSWLDSERPDEARFTEVSLAIQHAGKAIHAATAQVEPAALISEVESYQSNLRRLEIQLTVAVTRLSDSREQLMRRQWHLASANRWANIARASFES